MKKAVSLFKNRPWIFYVLLILIGAALLFLRRPDALLEPQFWGEDGRFWYADAYNHGPLSSLFMPYAGSLQIAMRLVASLTLLLPLSYAPLIFTLVAIAVKLLPAVLLNTKRFSPLVPNLKTRLLITLFYLLIPSGFEVHANLTNINWHLVILAFMVIVSKPSKSKAWNLFDFLVVIVSGLTGPFSIILSFIALLNYRRYKNRRNILVLLAVAVCAAIQAIVLGLSPDSARLAQPLGPNLLLLLKIIGSRIGTATVMGSMLAGRIISPESWFNIVAGIFVIGATALAYIKAKLNLRLFIVLSWLMLAAALIKPQASDTMPQWYALLVGAGARYFFFPILCFFICLLFISMCKSLSTIIRLVAATLIVSTFLIAIPVDFRYPPRPNLSFSYFEKEFSKAPVGQPYCLPINPGWQMCLNKR